MRISRIAIGLVDRLLRAAAALLAVTVGLYSAYALWDNAQVYAAADNVRADMLHLKPACGTDGGASFAALREVNPDVQAWLTLEGTAIDYPVLQGRDNMTYLNRDVYGRFALSGSIFLDAGCDGGFRDAYSLLYGHHMENSLMFGDLERYRQAAFFRENTGGALLLPEGEYRLTVLACLIVPASEDAVFQVERWRESAAGLLDFAAGNALHLNREALEEARRTGARVLSLSTCAADFTDARTVLLAAMEPDALPRSTGG